MSTAPGVRHSRRSHEDDDAHDDDNHSCARAQGASRNRSNGGAEGAARLAQAFLDGQGDGAVTGVEEPLLTFEVRFDDAQGDGVLIVDARTGTVRLATER